MTDHRPLKFIFSAEIKNPMVQRWALKISSMGADIEYIPGEKNVQADFLSRIPRKDDVVNAINTNVIDPKLIRLQRQAVEDDKQWQSIHAQTLSINFRHSSCKTAVIQSYH